MTESKRLVCHILDINPGSVSRKLCREMKISEVRCIGFGALSLSDGMAPAERHQWRTTRCIHQQIINESFVTDVC